MKLHEEMNTFVESEEDDLDRTIEKLRNHNRKWIKLSKDFEYIEFLERYIILKKELIKKLREFKK